MRQFDDGLFFPPTREVSVIDDDDEFDIPPRSDISGSASRKRKAPTSNLPDPLTPTPLSPADSMRVRKHVRTPRIKSEEETNAIRALELRPAEDRVKIFVGTINKEFKVAIDTLDKSPVLKSLVCRDVAGEESYVMHPLLTRVDTRHFEAVARFLVMDEYDPFIISNPGGADLLPKRLDGLVGADDYQKAAIRACFIYVIATQLNMASLEKLVLRKITEAQYHPYGIKCMLEMARIIFSRKDNSSMKKPITVGGSGQVEAGHRRDDHANGNANATATANGGLNSDKLEDWLVENLTKRLQSVLLTHAKLFFEVANHAECLKRGFRSRVFRAKVEAWELDDPNVVAIDDDE